MRAPETHWLRSSDEQARLAREYQSLSRPRNCLQDSVQLDEGLGVSGECARNGAEGNLPGAVQRHQVHLVERAVHEAREITLDEHVLA